MFPKGMAVSSVSFALIFFSDLSTGRLPSACTSTHLKRKPQEIEARLGGVHDMGLGLVETEAQSFQHVAHHFQRLLYIFSAHHDKVVRVAHEVRLQFAFEVPPLP